MKLQSPSNSLRPIVLYIVGYGRSGSTLLDRLLGSIEGCVSCGEIIGLWRDISREDAICSCGSKLRECTFWGPIIEGVFCPNTKGYDRNVIEEFLSVVNIRKTIPVFSSGFRSPQLSRRVDRIKKKLHKLYVSIWEESGARVIIDSSKHPLLLQILAERGSLEIRVIHLVRDSRAVVYSNIRKRFIPGLGYTAVQNPLRTIFGWNLHNLLADRYKVMANGAFVRVRYEDLTRDPKESILDIIQKLGLVAGAGIDTHRAANLFKSGNAVFLEPGHLVSGNAFRFESGEIAIVEDDKWVNELNVAYKTLTTLFTSPLLKQYGYLTH